MNSAVIPFQYQSHAIRTVTIDGEPWFVAVDICAALTIANARDAISKLDDDERQVVDFSTVGNADGRQNQALSNFDPQTINIINESGLYSLILTSRKPEAKAFKKWVKADMLPALHNTLTPNKNNSLSVTTPALLVIAEDGPRVDSRVIAEQLDIAHQTLRELLQKYPLDFQEFGILQFKTGEIQGRGQPEKYALLNEDQAYLLLTYCKNTDRARDLKKRLVRAFSELRRAPGTGAAQPTNTVANALDALRLAREGARVARMFGLRGNMVALSADQFAHSLTGLSVLEHMGATHLVADQRGRTYTPTELGQMCSPPLSARRFNLRLEAAGLQTRELEHWLPTDAAQGLFEWLDTGKHHHSGTPVKQIKWFKGVLEKLESVPSISDPQ